VDILLKCSMCYIRMHVIGFEVDPVLTFVSLSFCLFLYPFWQWVIARIFITSLCISNIQNKELTILGAFWSITVWISSSRWIEKVETQCYTHCFQQSHTNSKLHSETKKGVEQG
jgi:hypothetical protein